MQELNVQRYLRTGGKVSKLIKDLSLKTDEKDDLVLLNYNMIDSPKTSPIVQECRGLILRKDTWDIVSYPFKRFFNAGEGPAAGIDWKSAWAEEKIDGSLVTLFVDGGVWRISTRGVIDATGTLPKTVPFSDTQTFADLIWALLKPRLSKLSREYSYIFEVVSPYNKNVTDYEQSGLYLLTARDRKWDELDVAEVDMIAEAAGFPRPKRFNFYYLKEVMEAANHLPAKEEGFVVIDKNHRRLKVKNVSYLTLHKIYNNGMPDFWSVVVKGDASEVVSYFPEFAASFDTCRKRLDAFLEETDRYWQANKHFKDKKAFAMNVKELRGSWILFKLFGQENGNVLEFWESLDEDMKIRSLKKLFGG